MAGGTGGIDRCIIKDRDLGADPIPVFSAHCAFLIMANDARACAIMHRDESLMMRIGNERCFQQKKQAEL